jgi:spectinomycin phosphotransferase
VLSQPSDLDPAALLRALAHWDLRDARLEYLPVGFGSHHWSADRLFVTVDQLVVDSAFASLDVAYRTAASLRDDGGLEFVVAPLYDDEGVVLRRVDERYAVSVAPFVDGTSSPFGPFESKDERRRMGELLGRLHVAGQVVPAGLPRRDDFGIPSRSVLSEALEVPWETGPFAEPARVLLAARAEELKHRLRDYDALSASVQRRSERWVVTHGEPHRGNVIVDTRGGLHLVDWDTTLVAPGERDLWLVLDEELTGWEEYRDIVGDVSLDPEALELYRRRWDLADIAAFVALFRRPHEDDENTAAAFGHLRGYLDVGRDRATESA